MNRVALSRALTRGRMFTLFVAFWLSSSTSAHAVSLAEWVDTGTPTHGGPLVALADGTVLVFGFRSGRPAGVEQYHPDTGAWTARGTLQVLTASGTATLLPSGRVLLVGGTDSTGTTKTAELYDPATGVSMLTAPMRAARTGHRAVLLASGKVLVSGGLDASNQLVGPAEIYDPAAGVWSSTGVLNQFRRDHAAVLLTNGKVLAAGGIDATGEPLASAEVYDPAAGTWTFTAAMHRPRFAFLGVTLPDGRVLVASDGPSSELYDPAANMWAASATIPACPSAQNCFILGLVVLDDGTPLVVFAGCQHLGGCRGHALLFDGQAGLWTPTATPLLTQFGGPMTVLTDGRALLIAVPAQLYRADNTTPRLVVSPLTVDFDTSPGITIRQTLTLQNTGGATLTGSATVAAPFSVVSGSPFTLAPGMSTTAVVEFTPSEFGAFPDVVQFMSNGNWLSVPVTGMAGVQLSGHVTDTTGAGVGGLTVNLRGASSDDTVTDATGHYQFLVSPNNGYTVTPTMPGLEFTPNTRSILVATQAVSGLDFTAVLVDALAVFVAGLYENVLNRAPEPAGLAAWTGFLRQNCNPNGFSTIAQAFFDSQEFRTSRPLTLPGLVTVLYRTFLDREPEPAGLAGWVDGFRQARLRLAQGFIHSAEFQSLLPDRTNRPAVTALVTRFYTEILGRAPEPGGFAPWVDYIVATRDLEGAAVGFLASGEFEGRALTFRDYVVILYRGVLGREPDPGGLDAWENVLRSDLLRVLNGGFIPSAEFQGRIPEVCGS